MGDTIPISEFPGIDSGNLGRPASFKPAIIIEIALRKRGIGIVPPISFILPASSRTPGPRRKSMNKRLVVVLVALVVLALCVAACAPKKVDELRAGFVKPPDSARPWVYWFWLNSNITREGITADLEAMKRVGIGGVLIMEVDQGAPVGKAAFMGDEWRGLFKFAVAEAGRLGLEINMNDDAGWNGSGGPWITPEQSMQKIVWSEAGLTGPAHFVATLPRPEAVRDFYRDIAILAFSTPKGDY